MTELTATRAPTPMETMAKEREYQVFDLRRMIYAMGGGKRGEFEWRLVSVLCVLLLCITDDGSRW